jgi:HEAT repeat protein
MPPIASRLLLLVLLPSACAPSATEGGFDSPNPAARMYAIEIAARDGDQQAVKQIIESLDSDDPAVRLLAISTLERLTGETYGYRQYDPPLQRREAIDRWKAAYESGEVHPASGATDGSTPAVAASAPAETGVPDSIPHHASPPLTEPTRPNG